MCQSLAPLRCTHAIAGRRSRQSRMHACMQHQCARQSHASPAHTHHNQHMHTPRWHSISCTCKCTRGDLALLQRISSHAPLATCARTATVGCYTPEHRQTHSPCFLCIPSRPRERIADQRTSLPALQRPLATTGSHAATFPSRCPFIRSRTHRSSECFHGWPATAP